MKGSRGGFLFREVIPDPGGLLSFTVLAAGVLGHLAARPDAEGYLFRGLLGAAAGFPGGPLAEAAFEALVQAFLLVAPAAALYGGVRHLLREADSLLPYLTVVGGGFLSLLTGIALLGTGALRAG